MVLYQNSVTSQNYKKQKKKQQVSKSTETKIHKRKVLSFVSN